MNVIGYIRTSTSRQELSPDAQRAAIATWCQDNGAQLVAVHVDAGVSSVAAVEDRPGLSAALAALRRGDVLVAAKRDRIARDPILAAQVEYVARRAGARLVAADGRAEASPLEATIRRCVDDMVAAVELDKIRSRTRAALAAKRARGERAGNVPFGFRVAADGVKLEPHAGEREIVATIAALRASGFSLDDIAGEMNRQGFRTRSGGTWHKVAVHRALKVAA